MNIYCLQHVGFEGPARLADWAHSAGHRLILLRADLLTDWPEPAPNEGIIVLGGPMSVHDSATLPWLAAEKAWLKSALARGNRCVGLCLGAQLLAELLGGQVTRNPEPEIGWFALHLTEQGRALPGLSGLAAQVPVLHWHGETFSLPPDAQLLASSQACVHQAFLWREQVLGFQCHPEANLDWANALVQACAQELDLSRAYIQSAEQILADTARFELWSVALAELLSALFSGSLQHEC